MKALSGVTILGTVSEYCEHQNVVKHRLHVFVSTWVDLSLAQEWKCWWLRQKKTEGGGRTLGRWAGSDWAHSPSRPRTSIHQLFRYPYSFYSSSSAQILENWEWQLRCAELETMEKLWKTNNYHLWMRHWLWKTQHAALQETPFHSLYKMLLKIPTT